MSTLNCILHPHHVSLMRNPYTLQSLFHSFQDRVDPYYEYDGASSHRGFATPRFNVNETDTAYILDGEFPGVGDKSQITVEWLQNQVLIVCGTISPADTETSADLTGIHPANNGHVEVPLNVSKVEIEAMTNKPVIKFPRPLLNERKIGECQRSFTFPNEVDSDGMKASLANGLLRIVVPKLMNAENKIKSVKVQ